MSVRLLLLITVAAIVVVVLVTSQRKGPTPVVQIEAEPDPSDESNIAVEPGVDPDQVQLRKTMLKDIPLPGEDPGIEPVFHVDVEVDTSTGQNRLAIKVTEEHGFFVETLRLAIWRRSRPDERYDHFVNDVLEARGTLVVESYLNPPEADAFGKEQDIGATGEWEAEVVHHGRVRLETPENWPPGWDKP